MTFNQQDAMAKLLQTIARMDRPSDLANIANLPPDQRADAIVQRAVDDALALYDIIEEARAILKQKPKRRQETSSTS
jgi:Tfp pilus assembly ATPase PilU